MTDVMELQVLVPDRVLVEAPAIRIKGEGGQGNFVMLPRHLDSVTALVPGIFAFQSPAGAWAYLAIDSGILVKTRSDRLRCLCSRRFRGDDPTHLLQVVGRGVSPVGTSAQRQTQTALGPN
jgi:F-type H+-transporting ATPase subunit epsilon